MSFQGDFRTHLLGDATLTALVGDRIYPTKLPQGATLPAVVYFRSGGRTEHKAVTQMGGSTRNFVVTVQAYASRYDQADAIEEAVYNRLDVAGATVGCRPLGETQDLYDPDTREFITSSDYSCWYKPV